MHEYFMSLALVLARKGAGYVRPNPLVGALIVQGNEILGQGFHAFYGGPHAETQAIDDAVRHGHRDLSSARLYVTLEPCCHYGKTPPCTNAIIASGLRCVVSGMTDPNSLVAGRGIRVLEDAGIMVTNGILEDECRELNRVFCKYVTTGRPFVTLKSAISLDGKIATATGESQWISCEQSRTDTHRLRSENGAVMCGIGTVLADDPMLDVRFVKGKNPIRIVVDSSLRMPMNSAIAKSARDIRTIIATVHTEEKGIIKKKKSLERAGIEILRCPEKNGRVDLSRLMVTLGDMGIDSILLEGGSTLAFAALEERIVDRVRFYVAPIIIGGLSAKSAIGGQGIASLASAFRLTPLRCVSSGTDICVEGDICLPG